MRVAALNVQNQERIVWPNKLVVAKAYLDQLERSQALPADQITAMRSAIQTAERSQLTKGRAKLQSFARTLKENASNVKSAVDGKRMQALAEVLQRPVK
jgi:galactokinase/mevalonate kinase-like predicted kinase